MQLKRKLWSACSRDSLRQVQKEGERKREKGVRDYLVFVFFVAYRWIERDIMIPLVVCVRTLGRIHNTEIDKDRQTDKARERERVTKEGPVKHRTTTLSQRAKKKEKRKATNKDFRDWYLSILVNKNSIADFVVSLCSSDKEREKESMVYGAWTSALERILSPSHIENKKNSAKWGDKWEKRYLSCVKQSSCLGKKYGK